MKTAIIRLIFFVIIFTVCSISSSAQIGSITVKWNDDCYPPINNTDKFHVYLTVYRNLDHSILCGLEDSYQEKQYNQSEAEYPLLDCYCTDVIGGYHIIATVIRKDQYGTTICSGVTIDDKSCSELTELEVKVEMPS
jgi:hypothetical protein